MGERESIAAVAYIVGQAGENMLTGALHCRAHREEIAIWPEGDLDAWQGEQGVRGTGTTGFTSGGKTGVLKHLRFESVYQINNKKCLPSCYDEYEYKYKNGSEDPSFIKPQSSTTSLAFVVEFA